MAPSSLFLAGMLRPAWMQPCFDRVERQNPRLWLYALLARTRRWMTTLPDERALVSINGHQIGYSRKHGFWTVVDSET